MFVTPFLSCVQLPESFPKFSELQCRHQVCKQNRLPCLWSFCFQGLKAWEALHFLHLALSLEVTSELEPRRMASLWFYLLFSPFFCFQIKQDLLVVFTYDRFSLLWVLRQLTGILCLSWKVLCAVVWCSAAFPLHDMPSCHIAGAESALNRSSLYTHFPLTTVSS